MQLVARAHVLRWLRALTLRTFGLFVAAVAASIMFVIIARELKSPALAQLDERIELAVHKIDSTPADLIAATATLIGSNYVIIPVVACLAGLAAYRKRRVAAIVLALDAVTVLLSNQYLKTLFARPRPTLFEKIALPTDYSFPSGHSMSAVGVWGVIAAVAIALYPSCRRTILISACVLIPLIGLSRIYLGVHWPFDVLGGFLAGMPALIVSVHLIHRRNRTDRNVASLVEAVEAP
ncbi:MAG: phosphatase PAP2 family protein [Kofleriaceae bacterium]